MLFVGIDYWAVVISAIVGYAAGAIWYWAFGKPWMAAVGLTEDAVKGSGKGQRSPLPFVFAFVADLVMAASLAGIIGHMGAVTVKIGIVSGFFIWLGFVATTMVVNNGFARRKPVLLLIDGGHWLVVLILMGAIIGFLGVK
jgi:hypothetical protein